MVWDYFLLHCTSKNQGRFFFAFASPADDIITINGWSESGVGIRVPRPATFSLDRAQPAEIQSDRRNIEPGRYFDDEYLFINISIFPIKSGCCSGSLGIFAQWYVQLGDVSVGQCASCWMCHIRVVWQLVLQWKQTVRGDFFRKKNWFLLPDVVKITLKSLFSFYQSGVQTLDAFKEFLLTDQRNIVINNFLIHGFLEFFGRNNCWISREKFKPFLIHTGSSLPLGFKNWEKNYK